MAGRLPAIVIDNGTGLVIILVLLLKYFYRSNSIHFGCMVIVLSICISADDSLYLPHNNLQNANALYLLIFKYILKTKGLVKCLVLHISVRKKVQWVFKKLCLRQDLSSLLLSLSVGQSYLNYWLHCITVFTVLVYFNKWKYRKSILLYKSKFCMYI